MYTLADIIRLTGAKLEQQSVKTSASHADLFSLSIRGVATLQHAQASDVSFLVKPTYAKDLPHTKAAAVLLTQKYAANCPAPALVVDDPYLAYAKVSQLFDHKPPHVGVSPHSMVADHALLAPDVTIEAGAVVGTKVSIGKGSHIGANAVIEAGARIGEGCHIAAHVTLHHDCVVGDRVRIHAGACIGAEGFGFAPDIQDTGMAWQRIAQLGRVVIGNDVRIGANTCIDRGALGDTVIGDGVIIDNLVQIAHNVHIGEQTAIAACTGIAGSARIGARCIIAGGVGIAGHLTIADDVQLTGMSMVTGSIKQAGSYSSGTVNMPTQQWRKAAVGFRKLAKYPSFDPDDHQNQINDLKVEINALKSALKQ